MVPLSDFHRRELPGQKPHVVPTPLLIALQMPLVLTAFALISPFQVDLSSALRAIATPIQKFCLQRVQLENLDPLTKNMVCGSNDLLLTDRKDFLKTGTFHILVVSGSHFVTLDFLLRSTPLSIRSIVFLFFFLLSGGSPPALRALVLLAALQFSRLLRLQWSWMDCQILATAGILSLFCNLISSHSLLLSVVCATIAFMFARRDLLISCVLTSIVAGAAAAVILGSHSSTHPLSWFLGGLLTPLISMMLFPILLFGWLFPALQAIIDPIMGFVRSAVQFLAQLPPEFQASEATSPPLTLCWASVLGGLLFLKFRVRRGTHPE